jgi:mannose-6-phosphate isomerase
MKVMILGKLTGDKMNEQPNLYPLKFTPYLKSAIWGGHNLEKFGRTVPEEGIAESWEIAAHPNGSSIVMNGVHAGKNLAELTHELGVDLVGTNAQWALDRGKFPLLVKLLDANSNLSVQVHPKDNYALEHEGNELGKTEMWVILSAKPGAKLIYGVKKGTSPAEFREGIEQGNLEQYLHEIPATTGAHLCVPAGSLHAICEGIVLAEIQQNSDTTYRVYDWNRLGKDGQPRELHIDKALDVINFDQVEPGFTEPILVAEEDGIKTTILCQNEYFITERIFMDGGTRYSGLCDGTSLEIWGILEGSASLAEMEMVPVQFILLPAKMGAFNINAKENSVLLRATLPVPGADSCC